jgi:hypothetical protein
VLLFILLSVILLGLSLDSVFILFYCKTIFKSFNNSIKQLFDRKRKAFLKYKTIDRLIKDHNSICLDIKLYNRFWQKYYFFLTFTLIPVNLLILQLLLFEEQIFPLLLTAIPFFFGSIISHLMFNLMTASINSEASKSYKSLLEMYLKTDPLLNTNRKIKVKNFRDSLNPTIF